MSGGRLTRDPIGVIFHGRNMTTAFGVGTRVEKLC
jgi:hypothetical protein